MKQKLTGWYTGDQKPVRVGVYQRMYNDGVIWYCWWDGENFGISSPYASDALDYYQAFGTSINQNLPWRGIAK